MKQIKHNLTFITKILNEDEPTAKRLLALPEKTQIVFLESMLKDLVKPFLDERLAQLNEGNTWAVLEIE